MIGMKDAQVCSRTVLAAMGFTALGLFSFGLACVMLLLRPEILAGEWTPGVTQALTHLVTLGWIGSLLFAGAYLVGPKIAGSSLWSPRLPLIHLFCHVTGLVVLLAGFMLKHTPSTVAGTWLVFLGVILLLYNQLRTGSQRSIWTPANLAFQVAIFWLAIGGGVAIASLRARAMAQPMVAPDVLIAIHAQFVLFGFLSQMLLGISLRVVPELGGEKPPSGTGDGMAWTGWACLNGGLMVLFSMALAGLDRALFVAGMVVAFGILAFSAAIVKALRATHTRLTWGVASHLSGVALLVLIAVGALATFPGTQPAEPGILRGWMRTYISLALLGPFALTAFGAGQHLAPRMIWQMRFEPWRKLAPVPPVATLIQEGAGGPVFFSLLMAWIYLLIGQVWRQPESIRLAAVLLLIGFAWFLVAIAPALFRFIVGITPRDVRADTPSH